MPIKRAEMARHRYMAYRERRAERLKAARDNLNGKVNHKKLLKKYIRYISNCEGIDYIYPIDCLHEAEREGIKFTAKEWRELQILSGYFEEKEILRP